MWWQHVLLRGLTACGCVRVADGRTYARVACSRCHGAGIVSLAPAGTGDRRSPLRDLHERLLRERGEV